MEKLKLLKKELLYADYKHRVNNMEYIAISNSEARKIFEDNYKEMVDSYNNAWKAYESKKYKEAIKLWETAQKHSCAQAAYCLAMCYFNGEGVEKDYNKAIGLFAFVAEGCLEEPFVAESMRYVADNLNEEDASEQNLQKALELYEKSAAMGDSISALQAGVCYLHAKGTAKDENKAFEYLTQSAEAGIPGGQAILAVMYSQGQGTEKNPMQR